MTQYLNDYRYSNRSDLVEYVLKNCNEDLVLAKHLKSKQTALHIAIDQDRLKVVELLLGKVKRPADLIGIQTPINLKQTSLISIAQHPIYTAVLKGNIAILDYLLKVDPKHRIPETNQNGDTIYHALFRYMAIKQSSIPRLLEMMDQMHTLYLNCDPG